MKRFFYVFSFFCGVVLFLPSPVRAGIPVIDPANIAQNTISAIQNIIQTKQQIDQTLQEIKQYENMVKNTVAPAAWVWGEGTQNVRKMQNHINTLRNLRNGGNGDSYFKRFADVSWYRSSPCFRAGKCSLQETQTLFKRREEAIQAQKEAHDASLKTLEIQEETLAKDINALETLQRQSQTADGQLEALGYSNQMEGQQVNQLLQIRTLLVASQNAENMQMQALAEQAAQETASAEALREGEFVESPVRSW